jgi:bifunctional enzyme CysN/CysC
MVHLDAGSTTGELAAYLDAHARQDLLRFITCGSVDDGKSTLIGRLLYDSHRVFEDHLAQLETDSRRFGTQAGELDLALLVDGLAAEREQGITIDVAHRFFSTERRTFIVADTPGHEQYTRNMVTGASTADLAVLLVDARKGVVTQTRRHSHIVSLLGIRQIVLAVNKLDLVGYDQDVFTSISDEYRRHAAGIGFDGDIVCIPMSALRGDNVTARSAHTPWYTGPTLVEHLEQVEVHDAARHGAFRFPVQWVNRPDPDFRGVAGMITAGSVRCGDSVRVLPAGTATTVARIVTFDGDLEEAIAGQSVTLVLADDVDVSRGNLVCAADRPAEVADQFEAHVVWMDETALHPGRQYLLRCGPLTAGVTISQPKYKVDVNSLEHLAARTLELNEIGVCTITTDPAIPFDPYADSRDTGGFVVVDKQTNATAAAGLLHFALRRSTNVHWQALDVSPQARSALKGHGPGVVWLTGLSGAGKSTIANRLEQLLLARSVHTFLLDGDNVRHGLNRDLGFTEADRIENVRRITEVARLMVDAGLVVLVSFISPFRAERDLARRLIGEERFCEVHVDVPLEVAEARDPKGLYAKARQGLLPNFTGVDSPYEPPTAPEVRIDTTVTDPAAAAEAIATRLRSMGLIGL